MNGAEREALEAAGFRVGDCGDFLGLSDAERQIAELRIRLTRGIREARDRAGMTQADLAAAMKSTQPRVARIEKADALFAADAKKGIFRGTKAFKKAPGKAKVGKKVVKV